ncbi:MAG: lysylphosphatidylglycerol synthase transmembrane domain-containing protein, partial [Bacilli bacterium]
RFAFWVVKMLNKMHILKDKDYVIVNSKIEKKINFFRDELKDIKGNFKIFLPMLLLHIIKYTISFSIPFFVALTLNMKLSFVELGSAIILSSFLHLIITYIPIPGASGGSELFYAVIFRNFFKTSANVTSSLLIWRFITFYVGLLIGFIATMSFNHRKKTKLITETLQDTKIPTNISSIDESIIDEVNEEKKVKKDEDV